MRQILAVDNGPLDRTVTGEILTDALRSYAQIRTAACGQEALDWLRRHPIDLLILDLPPSVEPARRFLEEARKLCPSAAVLVTSTCLDSQIPSLLLRLEARNYLLKPYRPAELLGAVNALLTEAEERWETLDNKKLAAYLERLGQDLKDCSYKKCVETVKEYIDVLYQSTQSREERRTRLARFAEGIAAMGEELSAGLAWKLAGFVERLGRQYDLPNRRYDARAILEGMIDGIFDEMSKNAYFQGDDLKKVLNYIDRNIKRGVNLEGAAECVNMSSCYFSKFFKKGTGVNFINYVTDRKIEQAKEMLLETDMPIINIAYELSYNETNYFSKAFKKKVGMTPSEYRDRRGVSPREGE